MSAWGAVGLLAICAITWGCTPVEVTTQHQQGVAWSRYRTFAWVQNPGGIATGSPAAPESSERVRRTLERALGAKGLQRAAPGARPDLLVDYRANVGTDQQVTFDNYGPEYIAGSEVGAAYSYSGLTPYRPSVRVTNDNVDVLVVELVDAATHQLVWQGRARGVTHLNQTEALLEKQADKVVAALPPQDAGGRCASHESPYSAWWKAGRLTATRCGAVGRYDEGFSGASCSCPPPGSTK